MHELAGLQIVPFDVCIAAAAAVDVIITNLYVIHSTPAQNNRRRKRGNGKTKRQKKTEKIQKQKKKKAKH